MARLIISEGTLRDLLVGIASDNNLNTDFVFGETWDSNHDLVVQTLRKAGDMSDTRVLNAVVAVCHATDLPGSDDVVADSTMPPGGKAEEVLKQAGYDPDQPAPPPNLDDIPEDEEPEDDGENDGVDRT